MFLTTEVLGELNRLANVIDDGDARLDAEQAIERILFDDAILVSLLGYARRGLKLEQDVAAVEAELAGRMSSAETRRIRAPRGSARRSR